MHDKPPTPKLPQPPVDSDDGGGKQHVSLGLPISVPAAGIASSSAVSASRTSGELPEEYPAQFARPPRFYSDNETHATASFLKEQLGDTFRDVLDEDIDEDFARESDSKLYFVAPESLDPSPDIFQVASSRKATTWAAVILAIVAFTWFGKTLSNVLAPMALAMFLGYLIVPMAGMFGKVRIPRSMGYVLSSFVIAGGFFGVGAVISASVAEFRSNLPNYEQNIDDLTQRLSSFARNVGLIGSGESLNVQDVVESLPVGGMQGLISGGASYMFEFLGYFLITAIFMMFMIWEAERFTHRVRTAYSHGAAETILRVVHQLNGDIQRYVLLKAAVSALTASLAYIAMKACGLDFAGVLALIIFLANFIPYIGSIVATLLPGVVALLQFPSWSEGVVVVVLITLIQQILGNIVEPRLQGRSLNVSPLIILIALAYFGWMWGIVGMAVSVPIAAGVRLLFDQFDVTKPVAQMMRNI